MADSEQDTPTTGSQGAPGPQSSRDARQFLDGVRAGVTRYAAAVGHSCLRSDNEVLRRLLDEACDEAIERFQRFGDDGEPPGDWRIGLSCKTKSRGHAFYYDPGTIVAVFPSGTGGITCADGVLAIRTATGVALLASADDWVTA